MRRRTPVYLFTAVVLVQALFLSCDKIERPHLQTSGGTVNTSDTIFRKILLEEFTGFRCGTCPPAAVTLYGSLVPLYSEDLITIGVHASPLGNFTNPGTPANAPAGSFLTDYRTPVGEAWLAFFNIYANPLGLVNRIGFPTNNHIMLSGAWGSAVQSMYHQPAKFKIEIVNQYESASGNLTCDVKVKVLQDVSGIYHLSVVLTEDSIIDWQLRYPGPEYIPDYVHRHVLRGSLNGTFGDEVFTGSAAVNDSTSKVYAINLNNISAINPVNPAVNVDHCHIVAFVFDNTTKEIWQVEEEKVK